MKRHTPTLLIALMFGGALAQVNDLIKLETALYLVKTVTVDGKTTEKLTPSPASVFPGDVLSQFVTAHNTGKIAVKGVSVSLPVPKNTRYYAPESGLNTAKTEYSIDGGKTFATAPLKKTITVTENGKSVKKEVEVKPSEYNAVRWTIAEIGPGQSLKLGYRIQVK